MYGLFSKRIIIAFCVVLGVVFFCIINSQFIMSGTTSSQTGRTILSTDPFFTDSSEHQHFGKERHFPQAIIIGVKKGGTRALIDMLKSHPQITAPRGEMHFFDRDDVFKHGIEWYIREMPYSSPDQITIEKSPSYFVTPGVPERLHRLSPSVKLLLIVRNPIERALSDYSQLFNPGRTSRNLSFEDVVLDERKHVDGTTSVIRVSCYDTHIVEWLKYFSLEQMHIVDGDALIRNPVAEIIMVQNFLGIRDFFQEDMFYFNKTKGFYCWNKFTDNGKMQPNCLGSGKGRQHPQISTDTRELLRKYFTSHNERFLKLVKMYFDWK